MTKENSKKSKSKGETQKKEETKYTRQREKRMQWKCAKKGETRARKVRYEKKAERESRLQKHEENK